DRRPGGQRLGHTLGRCRHFPALRPAPRVGGGLPDNPGLQRRAGPARRSVGLDGGRGHSHRGEAGPIPCAGPVLAGHAVLVRRGCGAPPRGCRRAGCRGQQNTRRGVERGCGLRRLVGGALVGLGAVGTRCSLRQTETAQLAGGLSVYRASASTPAREQPVKKRTIFGLILIVTALLGLVLLARTSGTRLVGLLLGEQFPYDMPAGHWVALL